MSRREQGFTLIETLVTLVIVAVVGLSLFSVLQVSQKSVQDQKAIIETQQNARIALNAIAEDFRHVSYGKDATQASIDYANTDSVQFVADLFDTDGAEIITYSLMADGDADTPNPNDRILVKTVTDTTGAVLVSAPQSYGLASNGLSIRYFNGIGQELLPPVPQPELIGEIQVSVTAVSPRPLRNGNYHEVTLTTTIYPRNLPLTPSRSRPRPPGPGTIGSPNCEAITLNWTTPTTNTDDTPLPLNDISHFNLYVGTNPTEMNLNSRLARNINQWTVGNLPAGFVYYFEITCVGTNGVESYPYEREVDLIAGFVAQAPSTLNATLSAGSVNLSWPNVTLFEDGSTISTPIYYNVYRDLDPTFTADEDNLIGSTPMGDLSYVDNTGTTCNVYYYRVAAVACGSAGTSSAARQVYNPAPPSTVASLNGTLGTSDGELIASWTPPSTRMDGSSLSSSDIGHYYVYYDTIPGSYADSVMVSGGSTSATLTGLANCSTYYVNARAYDTCGFPGDLILSNEVSVTLSNPCTPEPPEPPSDLLVNSGDDYVTMTWRASPDCDLSGYLVYYGFNDGGPYTGVGATQGNSPVFVPASAVTVGNTCSYQLSGLDPCVSYYVRVTAIDQCGVSNESAYSSQSVGSTACLTCAVQPTCSPWLAAGTGYKTVPSASTRRWTTRWTR